MIKSAKRIPVVSIRMVRESSLLYPERTIRKPEDAAKLFRNFIGDYDREVFCLIGLNTKNEPTLLNKVSCGTLNASLVHPRETLKPLILSNSASFICCHNHPSGNPQPSAEDIQLTERLQDAATIIGIDLIDHIILGENTHSSMKEMKLI